jgi:RNA polymerase sigma factor (TIGR02999 family)
MAKTPPADVTQLLVAWRQGDPGALQALLPIVYAQLRRLAHARMRAESPGFQTLQTTALVHEAYVRLVDCGQVAWQDRAHFYAICARLMRRILVERARARGRLKRGGGEPAIGLAFDAGQVPARGEDLLAVDEALLRLSEAEPRKGRVVELRYFAGLTVEETAAVLGTSVETVLRDWKVAKLWLFHELKNGAGVHGEQPR